MSSIAVIMVGGPTTSNFRALGSVPAPLFPIAGRALLHHPITAAAAVPGITAVYVLGFYEEREFAPYLATMSAEVGIPVRYLCESRGHGSAGGLHQFRDTLLQDNPGSMFLVNCDVCCAFPLVELLAAHLSHPSALGTMLVKRVPEAKARECGEVVADAETHELLHYIERPETYVSDMVNTGVYVFSPAVFDVIAHAIANKMHGPRSARRSVDGRSVDSFFVDPDEPRDFVRLDGDILTPYAGKKRLFVHETSGFWDQVKSPGMVLRASELYMAHFRSVQPALLLPSKEGGPQVVGNCYVHASAKVHSSAKLGPDVSVAPGCRVGPGARLLNCILLDDVEVRDNAVVQNAIVGWKSSIGKWARVQGSIDAENRSSTKITVAILGEDVKVSDEVVVVNCIVLPHKEIKVSVKDEVIL